MLYLKADVTTPLSYISCGQFLSSGNWMHAKRNIDSFELIYGIKGCAYIQQDEDKYEITEGTALLLLPGHVHMGYQESIGEVSFYWMHFQCAGNFELLNSKIAQMQISSLTPGSYLNNSYHFITIPVLFKTNKNEKLNILIRQLLHCAFSKNDMALTTNYLLTLVLMELSQQILMSNSNDIGDGTNRKITEITEWLRININKDYSVEEIAKKFNFNKDYLCRIFKEHTGMSIIKYINGEKISKAKELLCCSEISIKEISSVLGFNDEKYFMKLFKNYENITPSEYRNSYYKIHLNDQ
ncbi:MAG TPA: AraC family transcriptional regulator [Oscillospiraceae bacterium]|nr:AraC family transcriptional regulator [Oscillospiraceae bacterium]